MCPTPAKARREHCRPSLLQWTRTARRAFQSPLSQPVGCVPVCMPRRQKSTPPSHTRARPRSRVLVIAAARRRRGSRRPRLFRLARGQRLVRDGERRLQRRERRAHGLGQLRRPARRQETGEREGRRLLVHGTERRRDELHWWVVGGKDAVFQASGDGRRVAPRRRRPKKKTFLSVCVAAPPFPRE